MTQQERGGWRFKYAVLILTLSLSYLAYNGRLATMVMEDLPGYAIVQERAPTLATTPVRLQPGDSIETLYGCLEAQCITEVASTIARAFPDRSDRSWTQRPKRRSTDSSANDDVYDHTPREPQQRDDSQDDRSERKSRPFHGMTRRPHHHPRKEKIHRILLEQTGWKQRAAAVRGRIPRQLPLQEQERAPLDHHVVHATKRVSKRTTSLVFLHHDDERDQLRLRPAGRSKIDGSWYGILYVKTAKAASSTCAGLALRVAANNGNLPVQYEHVPAYEANYKKRHREHSILFTSVREPASRWISWFYFTTSIAVNNKNNRKIQTNSTTTTSDEERAKKVLDKLATADDTLSGMDKGHGRGGFQLSYTTMDKTIPPYSAYDRKINPTTVQDPQHVIANVAQILSEYDFIILVERMEESLVAMALVMGLDMGDVILASSAKVGGEGYFMPRGSKTCFKLNKPYKSTAMKDYIQSDEWRAMNYGDYLLHAAVNQSLDLTIQQTIGQERFDKAQIEYRKLKQEVNQLCPANDFMPCTAKGVPQYGISLQNCYKKDFGCGYPCVDKFLHDQR